MVAEAFHSQRIRARRLDGLYDQDLSFSPMRCYPLRLVDDDQTERRYSAAQKVNSWNKPTLWPHFDECDGVAVSATALGSIAAGTTATALQALGHADPASVWNKDSGEAMAGA